MQYTQHSPAAQELTLLPVGVSHLHAQLGHRPAQCSPRTLPHFPFHQPLNAALLPSVFQVLLPGPLQAPNGCTLHPPGLQTGTTARPSRGG
eukprot:3249133-Lingulodinium_polyedra.AAC.1